MHLNLAKSILHFLNVSRIFIRRKSQAFHNMSFYAIDELRIAFAKLTYCALDDIAIVIYELLSILFIVPKSFRQVLKECLFRIFCLSKNIPETQGLTMVYLLCMLCIVVKLLCIEKEEGLYSLNKRITLDYGTICVLTNDFTILIEKSQSHAVHSICLDLELSWVLL